MGGGCPPVAVSDSLKTTVRPNNTCLPRAVRASSAVPFAFEPVRVSDATWVDGGLLSNLPVQLFDGTAVRAGVRTSRKQTRHITRCNGNASYSRP